MSSVQALLAKDPEAAVVICVPHPPTAEDAARLVRALELGIRVALPTRAEAADLHAAREAATGGGILVHPSLVDAIVRGLHLRAGLSQRINLTEREREVMQHVVAGKTTAEIGNLLGIRYYTVQSHLKNLFRKLEVSSRTEAAAVALRHHLL